MKKIIFRAPVQTASGYGVYARSILRAMDKSGKFDITVMSVPWGATPLIYEKTPEMKRIEELAKKFDPQTMSPQSFDASVQITIPNEFMKLAPKNICITAGIEVDRVAPLWQQKCNEVADVVVVPSTHAARAFTQAIYNQDGNQLMLKKPLYIIPDWYDHDVFNTDAITPDPRFDFPCKFNFLAMGLGLDRGEGHDRKNFHQLIRWFCEQFRGNQDVGLVLKLSMVNGSALDFRNVKARIQQIKAQAGCGQFPRIHLIHGRLSDWELAALFKAPNVKALVSLTHGEGYGLPILEAAACGLPVIATDWSGHLDFLTKDGKKLFVPVSYELKPIAQESVWENVYAPGTQWAWPVESDAKMKMAKVVLSYDKPKEWATELAAHIVQTFTESALAPEFIEDMYRFIDGEPVQLTKNALVKAKPFARYDTVKGTTLVAIGTDKIKGTVNAVKKTCQQINFDKVLVVTSSAIDKESLLDLPANVQVVQIDPFKNVAEHDEFVMKKLPDLITTERFMTIQHDGYVLNGSAWTDEFLEYDYIGAPWFWNNIVGNGALCIRSMKLARELQKPEYNAAPMDVNICQTYRKKLEDLGFKFAPYELASKFSVENGPYTGQFGWHGVNPFYGERVEG